MQLVWHRNYGKGYKVDEHGLVSVNKNRCLKSDEVYVLESQVEQMFYIEDERNENWQFVIKAQPRNFYNMRSSDLDKQDIDVDAYQQLEVEADVQAEDTDCILVDNFSITSSLATNLFMDHKGDHVVQMVSKIMEDEDFINDGEIEVFEESSEGEKEFDFDSDSPWKCYVFKLFITCIGMFRFDLSCPNIESWTFACQLCLMLPLLLYMLKYMIWFVDGW